jgi:hypothetical protein
MVFYPCFSVLHIAIDEQTQVFLFHRFFCMDIFKTRVEHVFSKKFAIRMDCD